MTRNELRLRLVPATNHRRGQARRSFNATVQDRRRPPSAPTLSGELAAALRASEQRLSALLEDRGRIGRDLHDCVLQSLYAIGLSLEHSRRVTPNPIARPSGNQAIDQLNGLIQEIRRMIRGLEYGTLEKFDLPCELEGLVSTYSQITPLQIALELQPKALDVLTGEEEREILNIVREALSNCVRHAGAERARIRLQTRGSGVRLAIEDNGSGFDPDKQLVAGYGLANMAARAKKLGGHLTIRSHIGRGTKIVAEFSLEPILAPA